MPLCTIRLCLLLEMLTPGLGTHTKALPWLTPGLGVELGGKVDAHRPHVGWHLRLLVGRGRVVCFVPATNACIAAATTAAATTAAAATAAAATAASARRCRVLQQGGVWGSDHYINVQGRDKLPTGLSKPACLSMPHPV